jgi:hypothetical protein
MINFDLVESVELIYTYPSIPSDVFAFTDVEEDGWSLEAVEEPEDIEGAIGWLTNKIDELSKTRKFLLDKATK